VHKAVLVAVALALCALSFPAVAGATVPLYDPDTPPPGANDCN
jgi:hypothetical protein